jgi:hypothetical protein
LLHQHLQLVELGVTGCKVQGKVISIKGRIGSKSGFGAVPSMVSSSCLRWSSHSNSAMPAFWRHLPARAGPPPAPP